MTTAPAEQPVPLIMGEDGVLRVTGSRVTLDTVVEAFETGSTAEEIAQDYSTLDLTDIYSVIAYYLRFRDEIEGYLAQRTKQREEIRRENLARSDYRDLRQRLLARLANDQSGK